MIRIAAVSMCLAFACVTPGDAPREYRRGVYPTAPPLRPGHGAPRYDPHLRQAPRSMPRPAPVQAAVADPAPLLGWTPPRQLEGGPEKDGLPTFCAEQARKEIDASATPEFLSALDESARRCMAATAWAECIEASLTDFDHARRLSGLSRSVFWDYAKIGVHVRKLVRAECRGIAGFDRYIWRGP